MNFAYQVRMHTEARMRQWPQSDREQVRSEVMRRLKSGDAWLWPEPVQMEMFA